MLRILLKSIVLALVSLAISAGAVGCVASLDDAGDELETAHPSGEFENEGAADGTLEFGYSGMNWMAALGDEMTLSQLSIPGTHESGARHGGPAAQCQNLTITQQLNAGIRFLDMRCRYFNDQFEIHHGPFYQHMNFGQVIADVTAFLRAHPSETVIMSVMEEYSRTGNAFEQRFNRYVANDPTRWYLGTNVPSLGQARGKIVLLRRFSGSTGLDWNDGSRIRVQDQYEVSRDSEKWTAIMNLFDEMRGTPSTSSSKLFLNYTSAYSYTRSFTEPLFPFGMSQRINPKTKSYLGAAPKGRYGIVVMDFADSDLVGRVFGKN